MPTTLDAGRAYVAIPAKNEAQEIAGCLTALARQTGAQPGLYGVVLCLNNCTDGTIAEIRRIEAALPFIMHVLDVTLPAAQACAGVARRIAMDHAASLAGDDGVILTTDADSRAAPDWLAQNLAALNRGADAVAGRAEIDPAGAAMIPAHLHAMDAQECAYAALLDEIRATLDPDPADPWPRHDEHSGASIAVTVAAYRRAGGMPPVCLGEDRAFFDALRRVDARIRHAPSVRVVVSARLEGRAKGGMADTMRRRMTALDPFLDDRLEKVADAMRRARARAALRRCLSGDPSGRPALARRLGLRALPTGGTLGMVWADIEASSPVLVRRPVPLADLPRQIAQAQRVLRRLSAAADPAGIDLAEAAD